MRMAQIKREVPKYGASRREADISTVITVAPPMNTSDMSSSVAARVVNPCSTAETGTAWGTAVTPLSVVVANHALLKRGGSATYAPRPTSLIIPSPQLSGQAEQEEVAPYSSIRAPRSAP